MLLGMTVFAASSTLFREKTLAEKMIEEQQRQIAAQHLAAAQQIAAARESKMQMREKLRQLNT